MKKELSEYSTEELHAKLRVVRSIRTTSLVIFALIILAWIVLGYWKTNTPVFISTVALAITTLAATSVTPNLVNAELQKRDQVKVD